MQNSVNSYKNWLYYLCHTLLTKQYTKTSASQSVYEGHDGSESTILGSLRKNKIEKIKVHNVMYYWTQDKWIQSTLILCGQLVKSSYNTLYRKSKNHLMYHNVPKKQQYLPSYTGSRWIRLIFLYFYFIIIYTVWGFPWWSGTVWSAIIIDRLFTMCPRVSLKVTRHQRLFKAMHEGKWRKKQAAARKIKVKILKHHLEMEQKNVRNFMRVWVALTLRSIRGS